MQGCGKRTASTQQPLPLMLWALTAELPFAAQGGAQHLQHTIHVLRGLNCVTLPPWAEACGEHLAGAASRVGAATLSVLVSFWR